MRPCSSDEISVADTKLWPASSSKVCGRLRVAVTSNGIIEKYHARV